jgi:hypothetical protein
MIFIIKPARPLKYWLAEIKDYFAKQVRWSYSLPLLTGLFLFIGSFTAFKSQIAVVYPFAFDIDFHKLDVFLHFGRAPWEWLHEFFSHPVWSIVFGYIYNLWFFIIIYAFFLACFGYRQYELGIRYLIASLLLWSVAGNGLALIFSSAGPCFYGLLELGSDPYAGLMAELNKISETYSPILTLNVQNMLWEGYQSHTSGETGGISAFPSLHVASSVLVARTAFAQKLSIRWFLVVFAAMILIGSVYLGWHYAVDGYAGIVLGLCAWWVSGPISRWYINRADFVRSKGI